MNFRWCSGFEDDVARAIANGFPNLERITVFASGVTNQAVVDLCKSCPNLVEVKFIGCSSVSDPSVVAISSLKVFFLIIICFLNWY